MAKPMATETATPLDEKTYRQLLDQTFERIDAAFETVDPDLAEVALALGTLTITFPGNLRMMLTPQPSPRQLWVAFRDRAWHFDYDAKQARWLDDRGQGIEVCKLIEDTTREMAGAAISIRH
jgi:iron donor protein CyaY